MTLPDHLRRQFDYEFWANGEEVRALSALSDPPAPAIRLLAHIIAAELLWLDRLQAQPQRIAVWPALSLEQCDAQLQQSEKEWRSYMLTLSDTGLASRCHYTNSKVEVFENDVLDVLNHVLLHSAYHRGQIALEIRRAGITPPYTDYIHAVRQALIS